MKCYNGSTGGPESAGVRARPCVSPDTARAACLKLLPWTIGARREPQGMGLQVGKVIQMAYHMLAIRRVLR